MARYDRGWVKIHRNMLSGWLGDDPLTLGIFITLICWANWKEGKALVRRHLVFLKRGELVTSVLELSSRFGLDRKTVTRSLDLLEKAGSISQKVDTNGRLITIVNYEKYQGEDDDDGTTTGTTTGTTPGTHSEEEKKEKKRRRGSDFEKSSAVAQGTGEGGPSTPSIEEANSSLHLTEVVPPLDKIPLPGPRDLVELWNTLKSELQPKVNLATFKATSNRWTFAQSRLLEVPGLPYWREVITKIAESDFCNGKNDRGWIASFDFLIRKETHVKAMEGQYENRRPFNAKPEPRIFTPIVDSLEDCE